MKIISSRRRTFVSCPDSASCVLISSLELILSLVFPAIPRKQPGKGAALSCAARRGTGLGGLDEPGLARSFYHAEMLLI